MESLQHMTVTEVLSGFTVPFQKGHQEIISNRQHFGLSFCETGQITYCHQGHDYVSDPKYVMILPKGQTYTIHGNKTGTFPVIDFECLNFSCDTIKRIPIRKPELLMNLFRQIHSLSLFEKNRAMVISLFYQMIQQISADGDVVPSILLPALTFLEKNYASPNLTNGVLAKECNISEVYFRKLFTKTYGTSPKQYIINTRIEKAKQLLSEGILPIGDISEQCGFSNIYHFSHLFKEKTDLSPSEFMKQNQIRKI